MNTYVEDCEISINFFSLPFFSIRLHGSYEALKYGTSLDGLSDLTGGIAENLLLKSNQTSNVMTILSNLLKMTSIVMCKWDKENESGASSDNKTVNS